jgi:membrane fusion protein, multidrug efflux system
MSVNGATIEREGSIKGDTPAIPTGPAPSPTHKRTRRIGFIVLGAIVIAAGITYGVAQLLAPPEEETDDAYVDGNIVSITARDGGTVLALHADNTQMVERGELLIDLDPATQSVALSAAEADLGRAVRTYRSNRSAVDEAEADIVQAVANLNRAQNDYARRKTAAVAGAVSGEEVSHAFDAVTTARAALKLAEAKHEQANSTVQGTSVGDNPGVLAAIAGVRRAAIDLSHMAIDAPVDGIVAGRTVQLGQRVSAGTPLMSVVPLDDLWIDANFRETQLRNIRVGQPVTVMTDIYGASVTYHGHVLGLAAGSGNAFALLPAQNATGNWIKIVQRVPVRIALDSKELTRHPLRIGLSVRAYVHTQDRSGSFVSGSTAPAGGIEASLDGGPRLDATIQQIIVRNMGVVR